MFEYQAVALITTQESEKVYDATKMVFTISVGVNKRKQNSSEWTHASTVCAQL